LTEPDSLAQRYPALFGPVRWGAVRVSGFTASVTVPDRSLIQSVNVVPFIGDRCVVVEETGGRLTLPGGTREWGESLLETARREAMEEAGAEIDAVAPLGYWTCHSERAEPWRVHLAHPDYLRLVVLADVRLVHPPTNPADGEQIAHVFVLDVPEAIGRFARAGQAELADLYAFAATARATRPLDDAGQAAFDAAMSAPEDAATKDRSAMPTERTSMPRLGVITDEISEDFDHALAVCQELGIRDIELRSIWGKSIVDHDEADIGRIEKAIHRGNVSVCCIASPFLKCHLNDESAAAGNMHSATERRREEHWDILDRSLELAKQFDAPIVRTFSFWRVADPVTVRDEVLDVLRTATEHVSAAGKLLGLENEYACNVATGEESRWMLDRIPNQAFGLIWDPGNEAALGSDPFPAGYDYVKDRIHHVHLKDPVAIELDTRFTRMGDGAIDYVGQFRALARDRYEGVLSLETHYKIEGEPEPATRACAASTRTLAREAGLVLND